MLIIPISQMQNWDTKNIDTLLQGGQELLVSRAGDHFFFFKLLFIFERERERERMSR